MNIDIGRLQDITKLAREIRIWFGERGHPEKYAAIKDLEQVRNFLNTLDLLDTLLIHFEINSYLTQMALEQFETSEEIGSLGWEFWQIDVEEFFTSNLLNLCYQLHNAWEELQKFSDKDPAFNILKKKSKKPEIFQARHRFTHFKPDRFEERPIAQKYAILRRRYQIVDGKLEKELAKFTMPKVATLLQDSVMEGYKYLKKFGDATIG